MESREDTSRRQHVAPRPATTTNKAAAVAGCEWRDLTVVAVEINFAWQVHDCASCGTYYAPNILYYLIIAEHDYQIRNKITVGKF